MVPRSHCVMLQDFRGCLVPILILIAIASMARTATGDRIKTSAGERRTGGSLVANCLRGALLTDRG